MKDDSQIVTPEYEIESEISLYDPFAHHFVSQKNKNEFLKSLEESQVDFTYDQIH